MAEIIRLWRISYRPLAWRAGAVRGRFSAGRCGAEHIQLSFTPGGFIFDASARALRCAVIPAGPGNNTEAQFELIEAYRPVGYAHTVIPRSRAAASRRSS
jgi:hypothetical protein